MKITLFWILIFSFHAIGAQLPSDWEPFYNEQGIELERAPKSADGLIPFRATTVVPYSWQKVLNVLLDVRRKPEWSPKLKQVKIHEILKPNQVYFSEFYSTPWPASDREFLMEGNIITDGKGAILTAKSIHSKNLEDDDHIQADVQYLDVALTPAGPGKTKVVFTFLGHMKGWMPVWLINIIQKKWPVRFLQGLKKQLDKKPVWSEGYLRMKKFRPNHFR